MPKIIFESNGRRRGTPVDYKAVLANALRAFCQSRRLSFKTEHRFAPGRQFSFDWAIVEKKIGIEYEGGMFGKGGKARRCPVCGEIPKGAHFMIDRIKRDAEKYNLASIHGWRVIRILPTMIGTDPGANEAIEFVRLAVGR